MTIHEPTRLFTQQYSLKAFDGTWCETNHENYTSYCAPLETNWHADLLYELSTLMYEL